MSRTYFALFGGSGEGSYPKINDQRSSSAKEAATARVPVEPSRVTDWPLTVGRGRLATPKPYQLISILLLRQRDMDSM